jgi:hypothetical protein
VGAGWPFSGSPAISKRNCPATVTVDRRPREWASADAGRLVVPYLAPAKPALSEWPTIRTERRVNVAG